MKTNLDQFYKTDRTLEKEGIWIMISDDVGFLVRRFGGANADRMKQAMAKHYTPYASQVNKGTIDPQKETEIMATAFVESCLVDWKGVEIDGEIAPFEQDVAIKFLISLPELTNELIEQAQKVENFKEELGNS